LLTASKSNNMAQTTMFLTLVLSFHPTPFFFNPILLLRNNWQNQGVVRLATMNRAYSKANKMEEGMVGGCVLGGSGSKITVTMVTRLVSFDDAI
jgi:hypothetical protein